VSEFESRPEYERGTQDDADNSEEASQR
jgi:hypothetical protein